MNTNLWVPAAALAVGLGAGFGIGKAGKDGGSDAALAESNTRTRAASRQADGDDGKQGRVRKERSVEEIYLRPGQSNRIQGLLDYYSNLSADQFASEAEKLDGMPFNERILASVLLFGKWAEVDPTAAMAFTDTMGFAGAFVRPTVLQGWASTDPVNAAKYYSDNPAQFAMMNMMGGGRAGRGLGGQGAAGIIAGEWAKQDPEGALAWATSLKTNTADAVNSVITQVAKSDPSKAAGMVAGMPEDSRAGAYATIAKEWGAKSFSEAVAWANGLPEEQRSAAMSAAIEGLAQSSPEKAAQEISKITDADARLDAVPAVARSYAREDVRGSIDWLNSLDDDAKMESLREVMPIWAASDSSAALDFIRSQNSPEVKDRAAESYIWSSRSGSPSDLVQVAGMISEEGSRNRATGIVAARWMQEDKEAATQFIKGSDAISADMKERLLSGRPMWGDDRRGRGRD